VGSVRSYVAKSPGQGVEKMARELGVPSRELVLPIKKLLADKAIKTTGHKRATKYFPGGGRRRAKA
jgi:predicted transcriptional regulator